MIRLTLEEIGRVATGELRRGAGDAVTGVTIDSRRVEPGDLFVAVGRGVDFAEEALGAGAAAVIKDGQIGAAGLLQGVGEDGQVSEAALGVDGLG